MNGANTAGVLYIIATPIGNREDISFRALSTLKLVDTIVAEDTRHSLALLTSLGIKKPIISLHAHNESKKSEEILSMLLEGQSLALISDAGTPLISDPGFPLVRLAQSRQIPVVPIPGPCALITALSAAGVACDTFTFYGFLPAKQTARRQTLESLTAIQHTGIFYESTHRILDCIEDIADVFGFSYEMVLAKELTKTFERFITGTCTDIKNWLQEDTNHLKGEFVLILPPREIKQDDEEDRRVLSVLMDELPLKQAVKLAAKITGKAKNDLYKIALEYQCHHHL